MTIIARVHSTHTFRRMVRPRLQLKVSLRRAPPIVSSCETARHSTSAMAPFSSAPLTLPIPFVIAVLSMFWSSCRSFSPRRAWKAREIFDWTRGTTPHPFLRPLDWSRFAYLPIKLGCQRILPLFLLFNTLAPPPPSTSCSNLDQ